MSKFVDDGHVLTVPDGMYRWEQYGGAWAIHEAAALELMDRVKAVKDWPGHVGAAMASGGGFGLPGVEMFEGGIAVLSLMGVMTKYGSSMGGAGMTQARQVVRSLARNDSVRGVILRVDSPGGSVAGTAELAADVSALAKVKPTWSFVEDMGASAAYWVASQAGKVVANGAALVGSIGVFSALYDQSEKFAGEGIKTLLFTTGPHKGVGTPGTAVSDDQAADFQGIVDGYFEDFLGAIMTGRGVTKAQAKSWATGQVWRAAEAEELGLIDGVMTFEGALSGIRGEVKARDKSANAAQSGRENRAEVTEMSESTQSPAVPVAASFEELEASLVGADAGFIVSQLKAKATLDEAKGAWMAELVERSKAADERAAKAEESANRGTSRPGNAPVGRRGSESDPESQDMGGSATDRWNGLVASIMKRDNCAKRDAVKKARREDEDLALAFTREYDAEHSALKKRG